jgi:hypothetical protein
MLSSVVKVRPEERLATTSELNLASSLVTGCDEAGGTGYWAATHVKGLSPEITLVSEADVFMGRKAALSSPVVRISSFGIEQGALGHGKVMRARRGLRPWHGITRIVW